MIRLGLMVLLGGLAGPGWAVERGPEVKVIQQALTQGGFVLAKVVGGVPSGTVVTVADKVIPVAPDGHFVVGFDRAQGPKVWLKACQGAACTVRTLAIARRTYPRQNVTKIDQQHLRPNPAQAARTKADSAATKALRQAMRAQAADMPLTVPDGRFEKPVTGRRTGVFGSQRLYNGEERSWHNGVDWAAAVGTPVRAPADGVVRLARDTFMSGNLVMLDHGLGVSTVYAHLDRMDVQVGQLLQQGEVLGTVGTTGRSSGPHLHWGVFWGETPLDPLLWLAENDRH